MKGTGVSRVSRSVLVAVSVFGAVACVGEMTPAIVAGVDACDQCGMMIDRVRQACGYVADGEFVTFDSPVCLLRSYEERRASGQAEPVGMYFADYVDASLHPVDQVRFLLTEHLPTVMNSGVVCFASLEAATAQREHSDEVLTDWVGFRTARGKPDVVWDVSFDDQGMEPEVVDATMGDLVVLRARVTGLDRSLTIMVEGYPEVEISTLPASGESVEIRLLASRPGAGFPIKDADSAEPLGRLRVSGAHTADEEAM